MPAHYANSKRAASPATPDSAESSSKIHTRAMKEATQVSRAKSPRRKIIFIKSPKVHTFSKELYTYLWQNGCIKGRRATLPFYTFSHIEVQNCRSHNIPIDMDSIELLTMAGFQKHVAEEIYSLRTDDTSLLDTVKAWIEGMQKNQDCGFDDAPDGRKTRCAQKAEDDWRCALNHLGMNPFMARCMLEPKYASVRLTQCSCYWVLDNVKQCLAFCQTVSQRIENKDSDDYVETLAVRHEEEQAKMIAGAKAEARTVFYKAGPVALFQQCVKADGSTDLTPLLEVGDFHTSHAGVYLHWEPDHAILEAGYLNHRIQHIDAGVLNVAIPNLTMCNGLKRIEPAQTAALALLANKDLNRHQRVVLQKDLKPLGRLDQGEFLYGAINVDTKHAFEHIKCQGYKGNFAEEKGDGENLLLAKLGIMDEETVRKVESDTQGRVWCSNTTNETSWGSRMA